MIEQNKIGQRAKDLIIIDGTQAAVGFKPYLWYKCASRVILGGVNKGGAAWEKRGASRVSHLVEVLMSPTFVFFRHPACWRVAVAGVFAILAWVLQWRRPAARRQPGGVSGAQLAWGQFARLFARSQHLQTTLSC
jgi:hypothetical protein